eukprot:scaffold59493_cov73-Phaeocystis_antarctica.AAC.10
MPAPANAAAAAAAPSAGGEPCLTLGRRSSLSRIMSVLRKDLPFRRSGSGEPLRGAGCEPPADGPTPPGDLTREGSEHA